MTKISDLAPLRSHDAKDKDTMHPTEIKRELSALLSDPEERLEALSALHALTATAHEGLREACAALSGELLGLALDAPTPSARRYADLVRSSLSRVAAMSAGAGDEEPRAADAAPRGLSEQLSFLDQLAALMTDLELSLPLLSITRAERLKRALWIDEVRARLAPLLSRRDDLRAAPLVALSEEIGLVLETTPDRWVERSFERLARFFEERAGAARPRWEVDHVSLDDLLGVSAHPALLSALREAVADRDRIEALAPAAAALKGRVPAEALEACSFIATRVLRQRRRWARGVDFTLVYCPPGELWMGSAEGRGHANERPRHRVRLTEGFWLGETLVTQELWRAVMDSSPSRHPRYNSPVEQISWLDAVRFCNALSDLEDLEPAYEEVGEGRRTAARLNRAASGYRLPTEAEWEYAAKAGTELIYAGSDSIDEVAWHKFNAGYETHPVARRKPNAWGLYDMSGNVYEWCSDAYVPNAYHGRGALTVDPLVASSEYVERVKRGGSSGREPDWCRVSYRCGYVGTAKRYVLGMRVARNA